MNDLLYYEPLADLFEGDATYRVAPTQGKLGYLTLAHSTGTFSLLGDVSPTYCSLLTADDRSTRLAYLDGAFRLLEATASSRWLQHATAAPLANPLGLHGFSAVRWVADVASTLLSNVGHTVVIRVVRSASPAHGERSIPPCWRRDPLSLSHRRYEVRIRNFASVLPPPARLREPSPSISGAGFLARRSLRSCSKAARCYCTASVMDVSSRSSIWTLSRQDRPPDAHSDRSVRSPHSTTRTIMRR